MDTIILHVLEPEFSDKLPQKITGITGNTQGASTLNIPATKEIIIRIIGVSRI